MVQKLVSYLQDHLKVITSKNNPWILFVASISVCLLPITPPTDIKKDYPYGIFCQLGAERVN